MRLQENKALIFLGVLTTIMFFGLSESLKTYGEGSIKPMTVSLLAQVPEDDVFQFFYWQEPETNFQIKNSVRAQIKGTKEFQEIKFNVPELKDLVKFRLDIGENKSQGKVTIEQIKFTKENEELVFDKAGFTRLFSPNKYVRVEDDNSFIGLSGKSGERNFYDPFFVSIDDSEQLHLIKTNYITKYPYLISIFCCLVLFLFGMTNLENLTFSKEHLFVVTFFIILLLPTFQNKVEFTQPLENIEKRELAKKPGFSFSKKFARDFEGYYNDNFGLRNVLIDWGGTYRTKYFQSSMHPELVMYGRNKWLFYNRMEGRIYRSYSRTSLLTLDQQDSLISKWRANKERYQAKGIKYFLGFWPNKSTIYPEHLPLTMKVQIKDTISRVDQLIQRIKETDAKILLTDVRPILLKNKATKQLYYKFDSHWNDYGAFLAYQDFFRQNKELGIEPKTEDEFDIEWKDYTWGELIQMLGVRNKGYFIEKKPVFTLKDKKDQIQYLPIDGFPRLTVITRNNHCNNNLRALVFRDSFTNSLIPFFSLHFNEVFYIWGYHDEFVDKLQPDLIIDGFVEREIGDEVD